MKNKILFLSFILSASTLLYSQTGIITYKTITTSNNKTSNPEMARKIYEEINRSSFSLYYNSKKSYFKKEKKIPIHSFEYKAAAIFTNYGKKWHQFNNPKKTASYNTKILNKNYIVNYSNRMNNWELLNEIKIIDGYTCYKAIRTWTNDRSGKIMNNIAWYTLDIPVPYGPIGNGGLPGLILKLEVKNNFYYLVDKITLNPKKMKKIPSLKEGEKISDKESAKLLREARKVTPD
ncbi:MAG: GLPGLI family protein [Polaribacter sp.]|uniref:GLPGLI family protein n=1 Tax=Polaribacter sp. TaxID=1920175 RepID=UPI002F352CDD